MFPLSSDKQVNSAKCSVGTKEFETSGCKNYGLNTDPCGKCIGAEHV